MCQHPPSPPPTSSCCLITTRIPRILNCLAGSSGTWMTVTARLRTHLWDNAAATHADEAHAPTYALHVLPTALCGHRLAERFVVAQQTWRCCVNALDGDSGAAMVARTKVSKVQYFLFASSFTCSFFSFSPNAMRPMTLRRWSSPLV